MIFLTLSLRVPLDESVGQTDDYYPKAREVSAESAASDGKKKRGPYDR